MNRLLQIMASSLLLFSVAVFSKTAVEQVLDNNTVTAKQQELAVYHKIDILLKAFSVHPDHRVAIIDATGGYFVKLIDQVVQMKQGHVDALYSNEWMEKNIVKKLLELKKSKELKRTSFKEIHAGTFDYDKQYNVILVLYNYHDMQEEKEVTEKLNATFMRALKDGGLYAVVDFEANEDDSVKESLANSRVRSSLVRNQVLISGFKERGEIAVLHNDLDTREYDAQYLPEKLFPDRYVLRFTKIDEQNRKNIHDVAGWQ